MPSYNKNYLKHVIIKVDLDRLLPIDKELPSRIAKTVEETFPLFEPSPVKQQELNVSNEGIKVNKSIDGIEWVFYGINREKVLHIMREIGSVPNLL